MTYPADGHDSRRRLGALGRCVNHCRGCPQIIPFCVRGAERPMTFTAAARSTGVGVGRRRRSDKVAACVMVLLMAVFSIGAPVLSVVAARGAVTPPRAAGRAVLVSGACRLAAGRTVAHDRCRRAFRQPPGPGAGGPRRTVGGGPAGSGSVPAWPLAARLGYGWRQRGSWPALRPATVRGWPTRPWQGPLPPSSWGLCCSGWLGPAGGCLTGAGAQTGKQHGPLSDPSGPSASGRKASPDGRRRHHKAAQAHRAADHPSARPASSCRSGER